MDNLKMKFFLFFFLITNFIFSKETNFTYKSENFPNLFIVKFSEPIKKSWIEKIKEIEGVERIYSAYFKDYSLLYYIKSKESFKNLSNFKFISNIKEYLPEYKTNLNFLTDKNVKVRVKLIKNADLKSFFSFLNLKKIEILNFSKPIHSLETQAVLINLNKSNFYEILKYPEVLWVEEVKPVELTLSISRELIQTGTGDGCSGIVNEVPVWSSGIKGAGLSPSCNSNLGSEQLIGIIDTSYLSPDLDCDLGVPNCSIYKYVIYNTSTNPPCNIENSVNYCEGGYGHGTATAGIILGNGLQSGGEKPIELCSNKGISFGSRLWALKCDKNFGDFDCFNICNGGDYILTLRDFFLNSFKDGSKISSHSWTSYVNGEYDFGSEFVDTWSYDNDGNPLNGLNQEYLWFFSTGNSGPNPNTIGSPATAKNDVSVGAFYNGINGFCASCDSAPCDENKLVCYSSRGPTDDGRYGPEISGPSQFLTVPANGSGYVYFGGTSASTPAIAGTGGLIRDWLINYQKIKNPSAPLIKALLLNSSDFLSNPFENLPSAGQGWGKVNLSNLCDDWSLRNCNQLRSIWFEDSFNDSGSKITFKISVLSNSLPLKCILSWFDPPNLLGGGVLINNLNLRLISPDNIIYLGNNFSGGWSVNGGTFDTINNSEGIRIQNPQTGLWDLEILGENIVQSPQPFSVACSGNIFYGTPKPIPDGSLSTMPMMVSKIVSDGSQLQITWDEKCNPLNTNIIYGSLSNLPIYQIAGFKCDISNPDIWNIGSETNIWFVLVSDNGLGTESSWGISSSGQRNGETPSNQCGNTLRDNYGTCP